MTAEKVAQTIQSILNESESPIAAFNVMQRSSTMRENLNIPQAIWEQLEPSLREKIPEIKAKTRKKRDADKANPKLNELPAQYPTKVNAVATEEASIASLCANIHFEDGEDDTDDDRFVMHVQSTNVCDDVSEDEDSVTNLQSI